MGSGGGGGDGGGIYCVKADVSHHGIWVHVEDHSYLHSSG